MPPEEEAPLDDAALVADVLSHGDPPPPDDDDDPPESQQLDDDDDDDDDPPESRPARQAAKPKPKADDDQEDDDDDDDDAPPLKQKLRKLAKKRDFKALFAELEMDPKDLGLTTDDWTRWRTANAREWKKLHAAEAAAVQRLQVQDQDLRTQSVQLQQRESQLQQREAKVERYERAERAYEETGDPKFIVEIVEGMTKRPYEEAQKDVLHKIRRSPAERNMERELAELRAWKEEVTKGGKKPDEEKPPDQEAIRQNDLAVIGQQLDEAISSELVSAKVKKIPHIGDRIRTLLYRTMQNGRVTMTVDRAARRILKVERARLKNHPLISRDENRERPPRDESRRRGGPPLRRESASDGAEPVRRGNDDTNEDIVNQVLGRHRMRPRGATR